MGFYRESVSLSTRPGEQMCVLSPAQENPPNTCSRRVPRPLSPPPPRREKVTVMDLPILINVNKQKRNIK